MLFISLLDILSTLVISACRAVVDTARPLLYFVLRIAFRFGLFAAEYRTGRRRVEIYAEVVHNDTAVRTHGRVVNYLEVARGFLGVIPLIVVRAPLR